MAIDAAMGAREKWNSMSWQHRASIFLKAADLFAGPYRAKINAATIAKKAGIDMIIMNGEKPEKLYDLFEGKTVGTLFKA